VDRAEGGYAKRTREGTRIFCGTRDARCVEREDGSGNSGNDCPEEGKAEEHPPHRVTGESRRFFI
jgi:hypothetical protein